MLGHFTPRQIDYVFIFCILPLTWFCSPVVTETNLLKQCKNVATNLVLKDRGLIILTCNQWLNYEGRRSTRSSRKAYWRRHRRCWFYGGRKTGEPGEKPSKHGRDQLQLYTHMSSKFKNQHGVYSGILNYNSLTALAIFFVGTYIPWLG